ncbi:MAG: hypothetical protein J2P58_00845 [Acidimicrobiaceae bacterium]|nr:hypothetical protein [Acidimicrobiaceae bacterium]
MTATASISISAKGEYSEWTSTMVSARGREVLLSAARTYEAVPELLGVSPHLLAVGRR